MATRTQMLQESRSQHVVGMNKYLKLFQDMRPPLFNEKLLDSVSCPDERKVSLATLVLDGEA
ncbi:hypothetical protein IEQ34_000236 [Dendrobium chrysotoxum]|uniref:Uncharacterized protein n=1 Tax=Dendrobium chrysotoxum TaxID=161865 RepID=A0AAV7HSB8_DENCH|nr:hypothetical protein IEQ34_000236 [Dendrobium chrysotoxum]